MSALAPDFIAVLSDGDRARWAEVPGLEEALGELLRRGQEAYPEIPLPAEAFLRFLARRLPQGEAAAEALLALRAADLHLLCALTEGSAAAARTLAARHLARVAAALGRLGAQPAVIQDIQQALHQQLLQSEREATRGRYSGQGDLASWLCVTAVRELRRLVKREARARSLSASGLDEAADDGGDQELAYLRLTYGQRLKRAWREALGRLDSRECNVLRYHFVDGLSLEELAVLYHVGRSTAGRWVLSARQRLLAEVRAALQREGPLQESELSSILRLAQSQVDLSLPRLLREAAG